MSGHCQQCGEAVCVCTPELELRPEVRAFARMMEQRLREKDADKGQSWKASGAGNLRVAMFSKASRLERGLAGDQLDPECIKHAVDLANYCMMIADVAGALELGILYVTGKLEIDHE